MMFKSIALFLLVSSLSLFAASDMHCRVKCRGQIAVGMDFNSEYGTSLEDFKKYCEEKGSTLKHVRCTSSSGAVVFEAGSETAESTSLEIKNNSSKKRN